LSSVYLRFLLFIVMPLLVNIDDYTGNLLPMPQDLSLIPFSALSAERATDEKDIIESSASVCKYSHCASWPCSRRDARTNVDCRGENIGLLIRLILFLNPSEATPQEDIVGQWVN